ncbi:hypothetical protein AYI68_g113 [Smittium mucronatum]|uniref:DDE-1 domain-containing protein n=1 Tax=Smittium mucronatum TaxID=133383 RepID=A0A1R0H9B8_9FUNG|nr:hypothetical protein AYI68_g113 [Smittium mucronatum]
MNPSGSHYPELDLDKDGSHKNKINRYGDVSGNDSKRDLENKNLRSDYSFPPSNNIDLDSARSLKKSSLYKSNDQKIPNFSSSDHYHNVLKISSFREPVDSSSSIKKSVSAYQNASISSNGLNSYNPGSSFSHGDSIQNFKDIQFENPRLETLSPNPPTDSTYHIKSDIHSKDLINKHCTDFCTQKNKIGSSTNQLSKGSVAVEAPPEKFPSGTQTPSNEKLGFWNSGVTYVKFDSSIQGVPISLNTKNQSRKTPDLSSNRMEHTDSQSSKNSLPAHFSIKINTSILAKDSAKNLNNPENKLSDSLPSTIGDQFSNPLKPNEKLDTFTLHKHVNSSNDQSFSHPESALPHNSTSQKAENNTENSAECQNSISNPILIIEDDDQNNEDLNKVNPHFSLEPQQKSLLNYFNSTSDPINKKKPQKFTPLPPPHQSYAPRFNSAPYAEQQNFNNFNMPSNRYNSNKCNPDPDSIPPMALPKSSVEINKDSIVHSHENAIREYNLQKQQTHKIGLQKQYQIRPQIQNQILNNRINPQEILSGYIQNQMQNFQNQDIAIHQNAQNYQQQAQALHQTQQYYVPQIQPNISNQMRNAQHQFQKDSNFQNLQKLPQHQMLNQKSAQILTKQQKPPQKILQQQQAANWVNQNAVDYKKTDRFQKKIPQKQAQNQQSYQALSDQNTFQTQQQEKHSTNLTVQQQQELHFQEFQKLQLSQKIGQDPNPIQVGLIRQLQMHLQKFRTLKNLHDQHQQLIKTHQQRHLSQGENLHEKYQEFQSNSIIQQKGSQTQSTAQRPIGIQPEHTTDHQIFQTKTTPQLQLQPNNQQRTSSLPLKNHYPPPALNPLQIIEPQQVISQSHPLKQPNFRQEAVLSQNINELEKIKKSSIDQNSSRTDQMMSNAQYLHIDRSSESKNQNDLNHLQKRPILAGKNNDGNLCLERLKINNLEHKKDSFESIDSTQDLNLLKYVQRPGIEHNISKSLLQNQNNNGEQTRGSNSTKPVGHTHPSSPDKKFSVSGVKDFGNITNNNLEQKKSDILNKKTILISNSNSLKNEPSKFLHNSVEPISYSLKTQVVDAKNASSIGIINSHSINSINTQALDSNPKKSLTSVQKQDFINGDPRGFSKKNTGYSSTVDRNSIVFQFANSLPHQQIHVSNSVARSSTPPMTTVNSTNSLTPKEFSQKNQNIRSVIRNPTVSSTKIVDFTKPFPSESPQTHHYSSSVAKNPVILTEKIGNSNQSQILQTPQKLQNPITVTKNSTATVRKIDDTYLPLCPDSSLMHHNSNLLFGNSISSVAKTEELNSSEFLETSPEYYGCKPETKVIIGSNPDVEGANLDSLHNIPHYHHNINHITKIPIELTAKADLNDPSPLPPTEISQIIHKSDTLTRSPNGPTSKVYSTDSSKVLEPPQKNRGSESATLIQNAFNKRVDVTNSSQYSETLQNPQYASFELIQKIPNTSHQKKVKNPSPPSSNSIKHTSCGLQEKLSINKEIPFSTQEDPTISIAPEIKLSRSSGGLFSGNINSILPEKNHLSHEMLPIPDTTTSIQGVNIKSITKNIDANEEINSKLTRPKNHSSENSSVVKTKPIIDASIIEPNSNPSITKDPLNLSISESIVTHQNRYTSNILDSSNSIISNIYKDVLESIQHPEIAPPNDQLQKESIFSSGEIVKNVSSKDTIVESRKSKKNSRPMCISKNHPSKNRSGIKKPASPNKSSIEFSHSTSGFSVDISQENSEKPINIGSVLSLSKSNDEIDVVSVSPVLKTTGLSHELKFSATNLISESNNIISADPLKPSKSVLEFQNSGRSPNKKRTISPTPESMPKNKKIPSSGEFGPNPEISKTGDTLPRFDIASFKDSLMNIKNISHSTSPPKVNLLGAEFQTRTPAKKYGKAFRDGNKLEPSSKTSKNHPSINGNTLQKTIEFSSSNPPNFLNGFSNTQTSFSLNHLNSPSLQGSLEKINSDLSATNALRKLPEPNNDSRHTVGKPTIKNLFGPSSKNFKFDLNSTDERSLPNFSRINNNFEPINRFSSTSTINPTNKNGKSFALNQTEIKNITKISNNTSKLIPQKIQKSEFNGNANPVPVKNSINHSQKTNNTLSINPSEVSHSRPDSALLENVSDPLQKQPNPKPQQHHIYSSKKNSDLPQKENFNSQQDKSNNFNKCSDVQIERDLNTSQKIIVKPTSQTKPSTCTVFREDIISVSPVSKGLSEATEVKNNSFQGTELPKKVLAELNSESSKKQSPLEFINLSSKEKDITNNPNIYNSKLKRVNDGVEKRSFEPRNEKNSKRRKFNKNKLSKIEFSGTKRPFITYELIYACSVYSEHFPGSVKKEMYKFILNYYDPYLSKVSIRRLRQLELSPEKINEIVSELHNKYDDPKLKILESILINWVNERIFEYKKLKLENPGLPSKNSDIGSSFNADEINLISDNSDDSQSDSDKDQEGQNLESEENIFRRNNKRKKARSGMHALIDPSMEWMEKSLRRMLVRFFNIGKKPDLGSKRKFRDFIVYFQTVHNISIWKMCKLYNTEYKDNVVYVEDLPASECPIREEIKKEDPRIIFSVQETGLLYRMHENPQHAISQMSPAANYNERMVGILCSNSTGSKKMPMWVVGNKILKDGSNFIGHNGAKVNYRFNFKSQVTPSIFIEWLRWFDNSMGQYLSNIYSKKGSGEEVTNQDTSATKKRVKLILSENSVHFFGFVNFLKHTKIIVIPEGDNSWLLPFDNGISQLFRICYRARVISIIVHLSTRKRGAKKNTNDCDPSLRPDAFLSAKGLDLAVGVVNYKSLNSNLMNRLRYDLNMATVSLEVSILAMTFSWDKDVPESYILGCFNEMQINDKYCDEELRYIIIRNNQVMKNSVRSLRSGFKKIKATQVEHFFKDTYSRIEQDVYYNQSAFIKYDLIMKEGSPNNILGRINHKNLDLKRVGENEGPKVTTFTEPNITPVSSKSPEKIQKGSGEPQPEITVIEILDDSDEEAITGSNLPLSTSNSMSKPNSDITHLDREFNSILLDKPVNNVELDEISNSSELKDPNMCEMRTNPPNKKISNPQNLSKKQAAALKRSRKLESKARKAENAKKMRTLEYYQRLSKTPMDSQIIVEFENGELYFYDFNKDQDLCRDEFYPLVTDFPMGF